MLEPELELELDLKPELEPELELDLKPELDPTFWVIKQQAHLCVL